MSILDTRSLLIKRSYLDDFDWPYAGAKFKMNAKARDRMAAEEALKDIQADEECLVALEREKVKRPVVPVPPKLGNPVVVAEPVPEASPTFLEEKLQETVVETVESIKEEVVKESVSTEPRVQPKGEYSTLCAKYARDITAQAERVAYKSGYGPGFVIGKVSGTRLGGKFATGLVDGIKKGKGE